MAATGLLIGGVVSNHEGTENETCRRRWTLELDVERATPGEAGRDAVRFLEACCDLAQQHDVHIAYALIPRDDHEWRGWRRG
jgi:hypothetical protein